MSRTSTLIVGSVLAALAVGLGAFGAHGLNLDAKPTQTWRTASLYHLVHALALVALSVGRMEWSPRIACVALMFVVGIAAFSGSLYALVLGGPHWLGPVTPLGGLAFMAAWLILAASARQAFR